MSTEKDKFTHSRRLQKEDNVVKKQTSIAKSKGMDVSQPHRYTKRHAMDCGNPKCMMCGNPRKTLNQITAQEKRLFQDLDAIRNTHSNGVVNKEIDTLEVLEK